MLTLGRSVTKYSDICIQNHLLQTVSEIIYATYDLMEPPRATSEARNYHFEWHVGEIQS